MYLEYFIIWSAILLISVLTLYEIGGRFMSTKQAIFMWIGMIIQVYLGIMALFEAVK